MTDETIPELAEAGRVNFSPHTFRHSYIMHMLYHRQPKKVIQALAGQKDPRSMEVYTIVFTLARGTVYRVRACDAAEILRALPPLNERITHHNAYKL